MKRKQTKKNEAGKRGVANFKSEKGNKDSKSQNK